MLLTKEVVVKLTNFNIDYYIDLGYENCKIGNRIIVSINDLQKQSNILVVVKCDYCGKEFNRKYYDYIKKKNSSPVKKDSCKKCKNLKIKESNKIKYNVNNVMQIKEVKQKNKETVKNRYGVENVFQLDGIKEKSKKTLKNKYNVEHPMYNEEIKEICLKNRAYSMYKNDTKQKSRQQVYIQSLVGGELNYPVDKLNLDIAFPEEKIYIEYNGGGHDLHVKMGIITEDEFKLKEIKRYKFLKSLGWKQIKIVSPRDYLPQDEILTLEINKAKEFLKLGDNWHYNIILNNKVEDETYGLLKKVL